MARKLDARGVNARLEKMQTMTFLLIFVADGLIRNRRLLQDLVGMLSLQSRRRGLFQLRRGYIRHCRRDF
jgi:hypothetical protein